MGIEGYTGGIQGYTGGLQGVSEGIQGFIGYSQDIISSLTSGTYPPWEPPIFAFISADREIDLKGLMNPM